MDDNEEPRPTTSKQQQYQEKRSHMTNSNTDVDKQDEQYSDTSISNSRSDNSHVEMGHERPKAPTGSKKERKAKGRKTRGRPVGTGRVVKRSRRPDTKRQIRKSKRMRDRKKKQELSISTIFTRLSSSISMNQACRQCGHCCCRRRFDERRMRRNVKILSKKSRLHFKGIGTQTTGSKCIQAGSRCEMLSPLCLNTNITQPNPIPEESRSTGITPEMIYEALKTLSMWRQEVNTEAILNYIKRSYPVGFGANLMAELIEKLRIAAVVGIVMQTSEHRWCLSTALQDRKISENHMTLFWKLYADTMKPVTKKPDQSKTSPSQKAVEDQMQSNAVRCVKEIVPTLINDYDVI